MNCLEIYELLYHKSPDGEVFCPYRISPLGAHIDHQYDKIQGLAIDKGIHIVYNTKKNGVIELSEAGAVPHSFDRAGEGERLGESSSRCDAYAVGEAYAFGGHTLGRDPINNKIGPI